MRRALLVVPLFALGCPEAPPPPPPVDTLDERAELLAPPANGVQLVGPEATIEGGADKMLCWVPDIVAPDVDTLVKHADGAQGAAGHHLFVFMTLIPRHAGDVFDCTQVEQMVTLVPLMSPITPTSPTFGQTMPAGYAIRWPANAQLVVQSHYVNVNPQAVLIRDNVNLNFVDPGEPVIEAAYYTESVVDFSIPPGRHTITTTCTMSGDLAALSLLGHMHEWGKAFSFTQTAAAGGPPAAIYGVDAWTAEYRDSPPLTVYPAGQPLVFHDGDVLTMTCEYDNDTGGALTFPHEMCTTFGAYAPARPEGFVSCDPTTETID